MPKRDYDPDYIGARMFMWRFLNRGARLPRREAAWNWNIANAHLQRALRQARGVTDPVDELDSVGELARQARQWLIASRRVRTIAANGGAA